MMMEIRKINQEIDWDALDTGWAKMYEEDYGDKFFNNNTRVQLPVLAG